MLPMMTGRALDALASLGIKLAAKVAPSRQVDIFPHRMYPKPWWHFSVYMVAPGWLFIEAGVYTVEVAWKPSDEVVEGSRK
jgi:hypothetical protein